MGRRIVGRRSRHVGRNAAGEQAEVDGLFVRPHVLAAEFEHGEAQQERGEEDRGEEAEQAFGDLSGGVFSAAVGDVDFASGRSYNLNIARKTFFSLAAAIS